VYGVWQLNTEISGPLELTLTATSTVPAGSSCWQVSATTSRVVAVAGVVAIVRRRERE
jgi:hypothetical protein